MSADNSKTTRRGFFVKGSATLGAGVAAAAGAGGLASQPASPSPQASPPSGHAGDAERFAILKVHQAFIADVENGRATAAAETHRAYRSNARQVSDRLALSGDGTRAEGRWHVDVKLGTPLEGDSTAAQMARL